MCSGLRSSSAKGAIALRQASACSWSTSSSSVLSDWTMRGPSFMRVFIHDGPTLRTGSKPLASLGGLEHQVLRSRTEVAQALHEQLGQGRGGVQRDVHVEVRGDAVELAAAFVGAAPAQLVQLLDGGAAHL